MFVTGGQLNYPQYSNSRVDELYAEAVVDPDSARRQELYNEIYSIAIDEDAAISPIVSMCNCHAFNTGVNIGAALDNLYLSAKMCIRDSLYDASRAVLRPWLSLSARYSSTDVNKSAQPMSSVLWNAALTAFSSSAPTASGSVAMISICLLYTSRCV